jgi:hypothetical protein
MRTDEMLKFEELVDEIERLRVMSGKLPQELRVGVTRFQAGVAVDTAQGAIDRLYSRCLAVEKALTMGLQLGESGNHGDGDACPTCHFVRVAREALGIAASSAGVSDRIPRQ